MVKRYAWILRLVCTGLFAALVILGCGKKKSGDQPAGSAVVGPGGGDVVVDDGPLAGASVTIPEGALDGDTKITISEGADIDASGTQRVGPAVKLGPEGQTFNVPVTVTFPYDASLAPAGTEPAVEVLKREDSSGEVTTIAASDVAVATDTVLVSVEVTSFSTVQAAFQADPSSLAGAYHFVAAGLDFVVASSETHITEQGGTIDATLDGSGTVAFDASEEDFDLPLAVASAPAGLQVDSLTESGSESYASVGAGRVYLAGNGGMATGDGETIAMIYRSLTEDDNGTESATAIQLGFREGTGMDATALQGDYFVSGFGSLFDLPNGPQVVVGTRGFSFEATADGAGTLSPSSVAGDLASVILPLYGEQCTFAATPETVGGSAPYSVDATGALTIGTDPAYPGFVSPSGELFVFAPNEVAASNDSSSQSMAVGVKRGVGLTDAVLDGHYNLIVIQSKLRADTTTSAEIGLTIAPDGVIDFDGAGNATRGSLSGEASQLTLAAGTSTLDMATDELPGASLTYTVGATGDVSLGELGTGVVTPSGNAFVLIGQSGDGVQEIYSSLVIGLRE